MLVEANLWDNCVWTLWAVVWTWLLLNHQQQSLRADEISWCQGAEAVLRLPVVDEAVDALLPQLPAVLVVVVVVSPAEHHQAFGLGVADVGEVFQQLLRVAADSLRRAEFGFQLCQSSVEGKNSNCCYLSSVCSCEQKTSLFGLSVWLQTLTSGSLHSCRDAIVGETLKTSRFQLNAFKLFPNMGSIKWVK